MKLLIFIVTLSVVLGAQGPSRPFPHDEEPPRGWFCHPAQNQEDAEKDAHACTCKGMVDVGDPICETPDPEPDGGVTYNPEANCKVFCHKDHCTCMVMCSDSN